MNILLKLHLRLVVCCLLSYPGLVSAATFRVDRADDLFASSCTEGEPNDCSLRGAVVAASLTDEADVIEVPEGIYALTFDGDADGQQDIDIQSAVTIVGQGEVTVERGNANRVFEIDFDRNNDQGLVTLQNLKLVTDPNVIRGAAIFALGTDLELALQAVELTGGGVEIQDAKSLSIVASTISGARPTLMDGSGVSALRLQQVTIIASRLTDNEAGAKQSGGAANISATLTTIRSSQFVGNRAGSNGGAVILSGGDQILIDRSLFEGNEAAIGGGALQIDAAAIDAGITETVFSSNSAGQFGKGGAIANNAVLRLEASALVANQTGVQDAVACESQGGALYNRGTLFATNVTFSGNIVLPDSTDCGTSQGGALLHAGDSTAELLHVTFAGANRAGEGNAIYNDSGSFLRIGNSIIAADTMPCAGDPLSSSGGNVEQREGAAFATCGLDASGDFAAGGEELGLQPAADNGGASPTHALANDSVARNAAVGSSVIATDQRKYRRLDGSGDIGAYEVGAEPPASFFQDHFETAPVNTQ